MSECRVKKIHLTGNNLWSLSGGVWVKMLIKVYNDGDYVYPISWYHRKKKREIIVKTGKHSSGLNYLVGAQMLSHWGHSANS